MAQLWCMHSDVLNGFYSSDIIVAADDMDEALWRAQAYARSWVHQRIQEHGGFGDAWEHDPDFQENLEKLLNELSVEIDMKLAPVAAGAIIFHKI